MNTHEQQIIDLIQKNKFLSEDLKKRYILALFLMDDKAQEDYFQLWKAFDERCSKIQNEPFILKPDEVKNILRSVDEVKKELIQKISASGAAPAKSGGQGPASGGQPNQKS